MWQGQTIDKHFLYDPDDLPLQVEVTLWFRDKHSNKNHFTFFSHEINHKSNIDLRGCACQLFFWSSTAAPFLLSGGSGKRLGG